MVGLAACLVLIVLLSYFVSNALSGEKEVSTFSSKVHALINEAEFAIEWFEKYLTYSKENQKEIPEKLYYEGNTLNAELLIHKKEGNKIVGEILIHPKIDLRIEMKRWVWFKID